MENFLFRMLHFSQTNFQIFPVLSSLENDGRGSVQFGQCEMVTH